jgi:hypothetical protein
MFRAMEVLCIDRVEVLGAGRARSEPSALGNHLQPTIGRHVARRGREDDLESNTRQSSAL